MRTEFAHATHRMTIPPIANLPARAPGAETRCRCGELVKPQRAGDSWVYYCGRCGHDWSEPAPRWPFQRKPVPPRRCTCSTRCRFCRGRR